jgi:RecJ-like exonuclease
MIEILGISEEGVNCTVMMVHISTQKFSFPPAEKVKKSMKERTCT